MVLAKVVVGKEQAANRVSNMLPSNYIEDPVKGGTPKSREQSQIPNCHNTVSDYSEKHLEWPIGWTQESGQQAKDYLVLEQIYTAGCATWDLEDHLAAHGLLRDFKNLFAWNDKDLGKTSIVKHEINLKPSAQPFKDRYQKIAPGVYDSGVLKRNVQNR